MYVHTHIYVCACVYINICTYLCIHFCISYSKCEDLDVSFTFLSSPDSILTSHASLPPYSLHRLSNSPRIKRKQSAADGGAICTYEYLQRHLHSTSPFHPRPLSAIVITIQAMITHLSVCVLSMHDK